MDNFEKENIFEMGIVAIEIEGEDASSEWLEEVSDEHYFSL